jgi:LmbE family N-acetylglucosaminyl deacetylase
MKRVLVVAAHPDDEMLGCGGTLVRLSDLGARIRVVFLAEGSTCRFAFEDIESKDAQDTIKQRNEFAIQALNHIGIEDVRFYNKPCGRLDTQPIIDLGKIVETEISDFNPDVIFTHSEHDANNDHCLTFQAVLQATRPGAQNKVATVLSFEIPSSSEWRFTQSFVPNVFIDIDRTIQTKISAFALYKSETKDYPFPRSDEGLEVFAKMRGMQSGCRHAEAFVLIRSIID